eukprot:7393976-Pyramimonas_sp.AAC.1
MPLRSGHPANRSSGTDHPETKHVQSTKGFVSGTFTPEAEGGGRYKHRRRIPCPWRRVGAVRAPR